MNGRHKIRGQDTLQWASSQNVNSMIRLREPHDLRLRPGHQERGLSYPSLYQKHRKACVEQRPVLWLSQNRGMIVSPFHYTVEIADNLIKVLKSFPVILTKTCISLITTLCCQVFKPNPSSVLHQHLMSILSTLKFHTKYSSSH